MYVCYNDSLWWSYAQRGGSYHIYSSGSLWLFISLFFSFSSFSFCHSVFHSFFPFSFFSFFFLSLYLCKSICSSLFYLSLSKRSTRHPLIFSDLTTYFFLKGLLKEHFPLLFNILQNSNLTSLTLEDENSNRFTFLPCTHQSNRDFF